jgi:cobalamin biosynthesis Mg chelatase CobN
LSATLATSSQLLDSLHAQLRSQAVDIDHLAAESAEQRALIKSLRADIERHQTAHKSDAQDLVRLAGRLLALSQATGLELDDTTKAIFRRRGWTSSSRHWEAPKQ